MSPWHPFRVLATRDLQPEIMDQPGLDERRHNQALHAIARLNRWSLTTSRVLWPAIRALARAQNHRRIRVLDLATGAGDVPVALWRQAARAGIVIAIDGCDIRPAAILHARRRAATAGAEIQFFQHDLTHGALPPGYDVLICSLFLHHLDDETARDLLYRMGQSARHAFHLVDLIRGPAGWAMAYAAARLLTMSPIVHFDAPRSVRGSFTLAEIDALAREAGLTGYTLTRRWPFRFHFAWRRP